MKKDDKKEIKIFVLSTSFNNISNLNNLLRIIIIKNIIIIFVA